jgi:hypothetical protein
MPHGTRCATAVEHISGNVAAQEVFSGVGIIHGLTIFKDVDGGTFQLFDLDDNPITPAGMTDYAGSYSFGSRGYFSKNGCKITTTGFTGGDLSIYYG